MSVNLASFPTSAPPCTAARLRSASLERREIALIGDTMNIAARILEACRATDNRVLASAALIERLTTLPPGITRRRLGVLPVRGKERQLELDVLEARVERVEGTRSLFRDDGAIPRLVSRGMGISAGDP